MGAARSLRYGGRTWRLNLYYPAKDSLVLYIWASFVCCAVRIDCGRRMRLRRLPPSTKPACRALVYLGSASDRPPTAVHTQSSLVYVANIFRSFINVERPTSRRFLSIPAGLALFFSPAIRFLFSERRTRTASTGGLKRLSTICPIDASQCCHDSYKPWLLKCVNLPPIAVNSTRVYIYLSPLLPFGSRCPFSQKSRGISEASQVVKVVHFPLFCLLSSLFIWSLLFDSFIPHTIDSSVNRLCGLISTWPPIPDERILQFTSSRTVDQRFPILFFFLFSFVHCFCSPPPFSDRNPVFSSSVTHPHFSLYSPFSLSPSSSQDARKTNRRALRHVLY